jgi:hypothetical protein
VKGGAAKGRAVRKPWGSMVGAAAGACSFISAAGPAGAQDVVDQAAVPTQVNRTIDTNGISSNSYDRGRNVSVRDRPRPDYDAIGLHVPGFMIYPKINLDFAYDDNIFAFQNGRVGDAIFTVSPEIDFNSTWSRNKLEGFARVSQDIYASHSSEDATYFDTGLDGEYDISDAKLSAGGEYGRFILPRSASNNLVGLSIHRIPYYYGAVDGQFADEFARVRVSARIDYQNYQYQNGVTNGGAVVFDQDQNHGVITGTLKGEFAVSPDTAIYLTAAGNTRQYDLQPPSVAFTRNSSGYEVNGGANFDITHLVRGEVQIGYIDQQYVSPIFKPIAGLSGKAQVEWFPTQLVTVTVQGSRAVGDAGVPNSAGYLASRAKGSVDYELLRNLILSGNVWVEQDKYNGVDRTDVLYGGGVSADYLINRHLGLTLAYANNNQTSSGAARGLSFNDNRVSLSATIQY